jgi:hypothetical protein
MKTNNILEVVFQSTVFMFEQYIWACFYLSFLSSWLSIFLLVVNIKSIEDFHKKILQTGPAPFDILRDALLGTS